MAILKCTICGGELDFSTDMSVGVCQYCDSTITIPKNLDHKGNLYNRAVFLRHNNEFDKAALIYEDILKEDNTDAEAHWGLVLSKFGIEYVTNPATGERHPTCHRTQPESILSDPDYLAALRYYDSVAASVIEEQAKQINEIQSKILEISRKEAPYDIFICYKETDDVTKERTEDSTIAQDLYFALVKQGYKVFFARKTLEQKLGSEYEPVIYAALNSAKVMIALGTKPEYFNAVWVRNEWSRFIKMAKDSKDDKIIIPAYRGFSAYELPNELSHFQSQDMTKIGFMQDLTDGIERCLRKSGKADEKQVNAGGGSAVDVHQRLIKNGETHIRLQNYDAAESVYNALVEDYPDDYRGWWGLILCKTKEFTEFNCDLNKINTWYKYARKLATPEQIADKEKDYLAYLRKVAELEVNTETDRVIGFITKHKQAINSNRQTINTLNKALISFEDNYQVQKNIDTTNISKAEKTLKTNKSKLLRKKIFLCAFAAMFLLGLLVLAIGLLSEVQEILIASVVICILSFGNLFLAPSGRFKDYNARIQKATEYLNECYSCQENNSGVHTNTVADFSKKIKNAEDEISLLNMRILACNSYLSIGNEKIADFCFALRCASFGMDISVDKHTKDLRDLAYGYKEIVISELKTESPNKSNEAEQPVTEDTPASVSEYEVNCPFCGTKTIISSTDYEKGFSFCGICGGKMEFEK